MTGQLFAPEVYEVTRRKTGYRIGRDQQGSAGVTGTMTGRATPRIYSIDLYTPTSVNIMFMSTGAEYHSSACSSTGTV
jgi:hypothetical protein